MPLFRKSPAAAPRLAAGAGETEIFTEVRHKRAIDLTVRDVIRLDHRPRYRLQNGRVIDTGHVRLLSGDWRAVLGAYRTLDQLEAWLCEARLSEENGQQLLDLARDALDRAAADPGLYVMLRLHLHELSRSKTEDTFVVLPGFALVAVQSRPAADMPRP